MFFNAKQEMNLKSLVKLSSLCLQITVTVPRLLCSVDLKYTEKHTQAQKDKY